MASLDGFDAASVPEERAFEALPPGKYKAIIIGSEIKSTKAGTGTYLSVQCEVIDGPHKGRRVYDNINRTNPNEVAVEIGNQTLAAIMRATDCLNASDSSDFHNKPIGIKLETRDYRGDLQNEIKGYFALEGSTASATDSFSSNTLAAGVQTETDEAPW